MGRYIDFEGFVESGLFLPGNLNSPNVRMDGT